MFAYMFIWPNYSDREEKARRFFNLAGPIMADSFFSHSSPCCLVLAHEGPLSNHDFLVGVLLEQGPRDGALRAVKEHLVECGCPEPQEAVLAPVNALTTVENWAQQLATHGLTIVDVLVIRYSEYTSIASQLSNSNVDSPIDRHCPSCDNVLPVDAIRCNKCGYKFI